MRLENDLIYEGKEGRGRTEGRNVVHERNEEGKGRRKERMWKGKENGLGLKFCGSVFGTMLAIYLYPGRVWLERLWQG